MMRRPIPLRTGIVVFATVCILALGVPRALRAQPGAKIHVHGAVYDEKGSPLKGVIVLIVPSDQASNGNTLAAKTDGRGEYSFTESIDGPFDIFYRHPLIGAVSVSRLSNASDQQIAKVLQRNPTTETAFDALQGLEYYAFLVELGRMKDGSEPLPSLNELRGGTAELVKTVTTGREVSGRIRMHLDSRLSFVSDQIDAVVKK